MTYQFDPYFQEVADHMQVAETENSVTFIFAPEMLARLQALLREDFPTLGRLVQWQFMQGFNLNEATSNDTWEVFD